MRIDQRECPPPANYGTGTKQIYALKCPNGIVRYVGSSVHPEKRLEQHKKNGATNISQWLYGLLKQNKAPLIEIVATPADWRESNRLERKAILENISTVLNTLLPPLHYGNDYDLTDIERLTIGFTGVESVRNFLSMQKVGEESILYCWNADKAT